MKTSTERQRDLAERRRAKGMLQVAYWIYRKDKIAVDRYVKRITSRNDEK